MAKKWVKMYGYAARLSHGRVYIQAAMCEETRDTWLKEEDADEVRKCVFQLEIDEDELFPQEVILYEGKAKAESKQ